VLVLLPPSEGKASGGTGPAVDLATLSWPSLTDTRRLVGDALATLCRDDPPAARRALGLSEALDPDRAADAELWTSPTRPAGQRYTGVLYDTLGYPALPAAARRRADASLVTLSGLWGAVRPTDLVPAYRIGIGTRLPGLPGLPALWHRSMAAALDADVLAQGAIDLRSSGYDRMWRPAGDVAATVTRVVVLGPTGARAATSYISKVVKGALAAGMVRRATPGPRLLVQVAGELGLIVGGDPATVTVSVPAGWGPAN
jgi:uncharacterized protein